MKKEKLRKKKATKKEVNELREIFVEIWNDPKAMRQAKQLAQST